MMKIKAIVLLLLLTFTFSFPLVACVNNEQQTTSTTTTQAENPDINQGAATVATENIINVYLIAGQSNAVGYGMDTGKKVASLDDRFKDGFENVLYYGEQERWNGKNLNSGFEPVTLGMGVAANRSGAEIGIASAIADNGEMNAVIKCAWGATHLYPDENYEISLKQGTWTSPTYIANNNVSLSKNPLIGNMYNRFENTVTDALKLLIEDGYTPVIKGVWWMQGEAEMFTLNMASAYKELYESLIFDTRNMLSKITGYDCSSVPFVCGLPKWNTNNSAAPTYQGMVRTAMMNVADSLDNVGYVDCMPLTQHDDWHFDAQGQKYLGEEFISVLEGFETENGSEFDERVSIDNEIQLLVDETGMEFKANVTKYNSSNDYSYGFIVVPTSELTKNNIRNQYFENLNKLYINYQDIPAELKVEQIDADYHDIYFTGKITNVAYEYLNTSYTAIAYIKNSYGSYIYSSPYTASSVAKLASEELYSDSENKEAVQKILNSAINYLNNVPFEDRENEARLNLKVEESINLSFSESATKYALNVTLSPSVDYLLKYSSSDPETVSVDENGLLTAHKMGSATITVECAGKSAQVNVTVDYLNLDGVVLDGVISENEYVGDVITAQNNNISAEFSGMIKNNNLYMSFEITHGAWSPLNNSWWLNDNVEIKLNNGASHTVVFYEGVPTYSSGITYGVSKTVEVDGKNVTVIEICIENVPSVQQLKVGMNGLNFTWLGAIWNDNCNLGYISEQGITVAKPINMGNGIELDGVFDEEAYTENVKNNVISANANGAQVEIIGTLTDAGVLYGVTVYHTKPIDVSTDGTNRWWTYMGIEFHFNGGDAQFMFLAKNQTSLGNMFAYCNTVETDSGYTYTSTFEIFIPYEAIGVANDVNSIDFTARGWFESGWCDLLNNTWGATHTITRDGLFEINK